MASSIPSILSRNLPAAAAVVVGASGVGILSSLLCNDYDNNTSCVKSTFGSFMSSTQALCEASKDKPNPFITPQPRETLIRKRVSMV